MHGNVSQTIFPTARHGPSQGGPSRTLRKPVGASCGGQKNRLLLKISRPDSQFAENPGEMRPDGRFPVNSDLDDQPISRTYQYRKVMKPMLERKRRARINRCLDELKELMVTALQAEGENVSKLEKADILELTVSHLHKLKRQHALNLGPEPSYVDRFRAGFTQCAAEVSTYLATFPVAATVDPTSSAKLLQHLGSCIRTLETSASSKSEKLECTVPQFHYTPPSSPKIVHTVHQTTLIQSQSVDHSVWRPW